MMLAVRGVVTAALLLGVVCWEQRAAVGAKEAAFGTVAPSSAERVFAERRAVARLRAHFDSVDVELREATVAQLSPSQRAARMQLIAWLRVYRDAGRFPENDQFTTATPFFVDHRGVRCAMGELLHRSGRDDIVRDVRGTRNNAYIAELVDDPRLVAWLDSVGLSAAEAARVQPSYDGIGGGNVIDDVVIAPSPRNYRLASGALGLASLTTVILNARQPSGLSRWAGLTTGAVAVITGAIEMGNDRPRTQGYASANLAVGAMSLVTAAYRVFAPERARGAGTSASGQRQVKVLPAVVDAGEHRHQVGIVLRASFR